jgi:GTPase
MKMFEYIDKIFPKQKREQSTGNREYKIYLDLEKEPNREIKKTRDLPEREVNYLQKIKLEKKINKRASQLRYRLEEGHGRALYIIGIKDDGTPEGIKIEKMFKSLDFLFRMVDIINAKINNIRIYRGNLDDKYIFTARIKIPNYIPKQLISI